MIILSLTLFLFVNLFRWAKLVENTTVRTFKDYINYSGKTTIIMFTFVWILITLNVWLFFYLYKL